jgi:hypothetical protein
MTSLPAAQTCQSIKSLRIAGYNVSYVSPYLFGGIVRKAAQHVKSNQGRERVQGREDNYYLENRFQFLCKSKDPKKDA